MSDLVRLLIFYYYHLCLAKRPSLMQELPVLGGQLLCGCKQQRDDYSIKGSSLHAIIIMRNESILPAVQCLGRADKCVVSDDQSR